jgi:hypothetical protein
MFTPFCSWKRKGPSHIPRSIVAELADISVVGQS